jgi:hypothetical protein
VPDGFPARAVPVVFAANTESLILLDQAHLTTFPAIPANQVWKSWKQAGILNYHMFRFALGSGGASGTPPEPELWRGIRTRFG